MDKLKAIFNWIKDNLTLVFGAISAILFLIVRKQSSKLRIGEIEKELAKVEVKIEETKKKFDEGEQERVEAKKTYKQLLEEYEEKYGKE